MRPQLPDCSCAWKVQDPKCPYHGTGAKSPAGAPDPMSDENRALLDDAKALLVKLAKEIDALPSGVARTTFNPYWEPIARMIHRINWRQEDLLPPSHRLYGTSPWD